MVGGGYSSSQSQNTAYQGGTAAEKNQLPFLQNLWGASKDYMANQAQGVAQQGQDWISGAQKVLQGQMTPADVQQQMNYYGQQAGQQFREQILPQIQGQAGLYGGLGSSRNQLAQGYAGAQAQQGIQNMTNQLYDTNQNRAAQAAGLMPQFANAFGSMGWMPYQNYAGILGQMQQQNLGGW
jgi:hypothetical protein